MRRASPSAPGAPARPERRSRLGQQLAHETPVADHIELEPEGLGDARRDLGQGTNRDGGQAKRHTRRLRRPRRLNLAPPRLHTGQADRRQGDGHGQRLAEQPHAQIDRRNVAQHPLAQGDGAEVLDIAA